MVDMVELSGSFLLDEYMIVACLMVMIWLQTWAACLESLLMSAGFGSAHLKMLRLPYNENFTQPIWHGNNVGDLDNNDPSSLWLRLKFPGAEKFGHAHLATLAGIDIGSVALACGDPDVPFPLNYWQIGGQLAPYIRFAIQLGIG